jgi:hypothetical protein
MSAQAERTTVSPLRQIARRWCNWADGTLGIRGPQFSPQTWEPPASASCQVYGDLEMKGKFSLDIPPAEAQPRRFTRR